MGRKEREYRITIIGTTGVGKTTFFIMMYHALNNLPEGSDFYSINKEAKSYFRQNIKILEANPNWATFYQRISGTAQTYDLSSVLDLQGAPLYNLSLVDYMGESMTSEKFDLTDEMDEDLRSAILDSDGLIFFIDAEQAFDRRTRMIIESQKEDIKNVFRNLLHSTEEDQLDIPIAIVLNKIDAVMTDLDASARNIEGIQKWFLQQIGNLKRKIDEWCPSQEFFFLSSKLYHEKLFSSVGMGFHHELKAARDAGDKSMYDPASPMLWIINQLEDKVRDQENLQMIQAIRNKLAKAQQQYSEVATTFASISYPGLVQSDAKFQFQQTEILLQNLKEELALVSENIANQDYYSAETLLVRAGATIEKIQRNTAQLTKGQAAYQQKCTELNNRLVDFQSQAESQFTSANNYSSKQGLDLSEHLVPMATILNNLKELSQQGTTARKNQNLGQLEKLTALASEAFNKFSIQNNLASNKINHFKQNKQKRTLITVLVITGALIASFFTLNSMDIFSANANNPQEELSGEDNINLLIDTSIWIVGKTRSLKTNVKLRISPEIKRKDANLIRLLNKEEDVVTIIGKYTPLDTVPNGCLSEGDDYIVKKEKDILYEEGHWLKVRTSQNEEGFVWGWCISDN